MSEQVIKFREARRLAKLFPDRFKLSAKIVKGNFIWACFEYREGSMKPELYSESHKNLTTWGWNVTKGKVHDFSGDICEFVFLSA